MAFKKKDKNEVKKISGLNILLNKYYKILKSILLVSVIIILLVFLVQNKLISVRAEKQALLEEKTNELQGLEEYTQKLKELEKIITDFKATQVKNVDKLSQILPHQAEVPNLMAQLEALTLASGFRLTSLDVMEGSLIEEESKTTTKVAPTTTTMEPEPNIPQLDPAIKIIRISLNVTGGDYFNLKTLLSNIEKHIRLLDLNSISFSNQGEGGQFILGLITYYFID